MVMKVIKKDTKFKFYEKNHKYFQNILIYKTIYDAKNNLPKKSTYFRRWHK